MYRQHFGSITRVQRNILVAIFGEVGGWTPVYMWRCREFAYPPWRGVVRMGDGNRGDALWQWIGRRDVDEMSTGGFTDRPRPMQVTTGVENAKTVLPQPVGKVGIGEIHLDKSLRPESAL